MNNENRLEVNKVIAYDVNTALGVEKNLKTFKSG